MLGHDNSLNTLKETEKADLEKKFNELSTSINRRSKKYFHLETVKNFIYYFEKIPTERAQLWIFENLMSYFADCEIYKDIVERNISKELYRQHLDKIGDYYRENLNFTLYASLDIILIIFAFVFVFLKFLFSWFFCIALIGSSFLAYIFYLFYKRKINKTFGFFH